MADWVDRIKKQSGLIRASSVRTTEKDKPEKHCMGALSVCDNYLDIVVQKPVDIKIIGD